MYRVDVHACVDDKTKKTQVQGHLYASLSTAVGGDGRLLTIGRKNATIILDKDKSVSREHIHLHLMSNQEEHQQQVVWNDDEKIAEAAMKPSNAEETEACELNSMGMALLVKNLGKFGTTLIALGPNDNGPQTVVSTKKKKKENGSDTDDGSDTEDESQEMEIEAAASQGKLPENLPNIKWYQQVKEIHASLVEQRKTHRLLSVKKLDAKDSFAIPGNATTIILQAGQYGSTIILTRMDLKICRSAWGNAKKTVERMQKSLHSVGGVLQQDEGTEEVLFEAAQTIRMAGDFYDKTVLPRGSPPLPPVTYMVVPKKQSVPKQLVAWNLGIPFCNVEYLEALMKRQSPQDEWPSLADYNPPSGVTIKDLQDFWDNTAPNQSTLWETCTFLSPAEKQKDNETIVRAAGGAVIQVYKLDEAEAKEAIESVLKDPARKDGVFSITAPGRSKIRTWIKDEGVPHLKAKEIVLTLCRQEQLKDDKTDRVIAGNPDAAKEGNVPEPSSEEAEKASEEATGTTPKSGEENEKPDNEAPKPDGKRKRAASKDETEKSDNDLQKKVATPEKAAKEVSKEKQAGKKKAASPSQSQTPGGTRRRKNVPVESSDSDDSDSDDDNNNNNTQKPPPAKKSRTTKTDASRDNNKDQEATKKAEQDKGDRKEVAKNKKSNDKADGEEKGEEPGDETPQGKKASKKADAKDSDDDDQKDDANPAKPADENVSEGNDVSEQNDDESPSAGQSRDAKSDDNESKKEKDESNKAKKNKDKTKANDTRKRRRGDEEEEVGSLPRSKKTKDKNNADEPRQRESRSRRRADVSAEEEDSMDIGGSNLNESMESGKASQGRNPSRSKKRRADSQAVDPHDEGPKKVAKKEIRSYKTPISGDGTAKLEKTQDGWFVAASQKNRKAYLRPKQELMEKLEEGAKLPPEVETVVCSGLIVTQYDPNRNKNLGIKAKSKGGKDFKRFRKNSIIKGSRLSFVMRAVLPKESEQQRALEEQQKAFDDQQRLADELFNGGGTTRKKSRATTRRRRN